MYLCTSAHMHKCVRMYYIELLVLVLIPFYYFASSYQSPIPADQVKPLAEYDYEGGNAKSFTFLSDCNPFVVCQLTFSLFLLI